MGQPQKYLILFVNQKQSIINVYKSQLTLKLTVTSPGLEHNLCILHCHRRYYQVPTQPKIINGKTKTVEKEVNAAKSDWDQSHSHVLSVNSFNTKVSSTSLVHS